MHGSRAAGQRVSQHTYLAAACHHSFCCHCWLLALPTNHRKPPQYTASFVGVAFPKGQRLISRDVPGVTKASMVMTLADVGAGMEAAVVYRQRFAAGSSDGGGPGVVADRSVVKMCSDVGCELMLG